MTSEVISSEIHPWAFADTSWAFHLASGFIAVRYPDRKGVFFRRDTMAKSQPYLAEHVAESGGAWDCDSAIAITEIGPYNMVTLQVPSTGYKEEAVAASSDEGQGLLKDSIAGKAASEMVDLGQTLVDAAVVARMIETEANLRRDLEEVDALDDEDDPDRESRFYPKRT